MKKEKIKGLQATNQLFDALVKAGWKKRIFYPVFPLKDGYCKVEAGIDEPKPKTIEDETGSWLLEEPIDPLTDYGKKLVLYFTGGKGLNEISYLKAFLCQSCGVAAPESYRWKDILAALELYRESNQIGREAIENYNPITAYFHFVDDVSFDGRSLRITGKGHRDILKLLVENFGCIVGFDEIESKLESKGEENRRQALTALRKAIADLPFEIQTEKKIGAMIRLKG